MANIYLITKLDKFQFNYLCQQNYLLDNKSVDNSKSNIISNDLPQDFNRILFKQYKNLIIYNHIKNYINSILLNNLLFIST